MEEYITELISHFGPYEIVFKNNEGSNTYIYLDTNIDLTIYVTEANKLCDENIEYALGYDKDEGCLIPIDGYKPIPDYKDLIVYDFKYCYMIYNQDEIFYASDERLYKHHEMLRCLYNPQKIDLPEISVEKIIEIMRLEPIEYDADYGYMIWLKNDEIIYSIPSIPIEIERKYMLSRRGICRQLLNMLPFDKDIDVLATSIGTFFIVDDHIILIAEDRRCTYQCHYGKPCCEIYPIKDHPYIPYISAGDAITMIEYTDRQHWMDNTIDKFLKLEYPYNELKEGIIPYGMIRSDVTDIQAQYHFSMIKAGYPYLMNGTAIDDKVILLTKSDNRVYKRVKYPIDLNRYDNILELKYSEDIPVSLLKKCNVARSHESGDEGYDLEIDAIILDQSYLKNIPKSLKTPRVYYDMKILCNK